MRLVPLTSDEVNEVVKAIKDIEERSSQVMTTYQWIYLRYWEAVD